nr:N-formylglutamate amidohydrolase [Sphingobium sp.]
MTSATRFTPLLTPREPAPYRVLERHNLSFLIVCDHAGHWIPTRLGDLDMALSDRLDHIGWDPGAVEVARRVAARLDAPLVEGVYSRLVIDCNRYPDAVDAMPAVSDGRRVRANEGLGEWDRQARIAGIFIPYHQVIADHLDRALAAGVTPALLSIHSCAPSMYGVPRPWEIGVGWTRDTRMSAPLLNALNKRGNVIVGDNAPYGLDIGMDFTTPEHAMARGLAHLQLEFRQDLVADNAGAIHWADQFVDALEGITDRNGWHEAIMHLTPDDRIGGFAEWRRQSVAARHMARDGV